MDAHTKNIELRNAFLEASRGKCADCTTKTCGHDTEMPLDNVIENHIPNGRMPAHIRNNIERCLHMPTYVKQD